MTEKAELKESGVKNLHRAADGLKNIVDGVMDLVDGVSRGIDDIKDFFSDGRDESEEKPANKIIEGETVNNHTET